MLMTPYFSYQLHLKTYLKLGGQLMRGFDYLCWNMALCRVTRITLCSLRGTKETSYFDYLCRWYNHYRRWPREDTEAWRPSLKGVWDEESRRLEIFPWNWSGSIQARYILFQRKYILDMLPEIGMIECKPVDTPVSQNQKLGELPYGVPTNKERY